jgi:glycosyltransferase involved in cell wall biosynthesis
MSAADVSVIIPCHNDGKYLAQSIESVCVQTVPDWECIVVDDGSTDETAELARSFASREARIRCITQRHAGLAAARNRGLDEARGRYIQFLDADDWIEPTKFERQLLSMKAEVKSSLSYCDYIRCCAESVSPGWAPFRQTPDLDVEDPLRDLAARWEDGLSIPAHCFLFDARLFSQGRLRFDETLRNHEDWDCWMRVFATNPKIFHVPEALATYQYRSGSIASNLSPMRKGFLIALRKQERLFRDDPDMQALLRATRQRVRRQYRDYRFPRSVYLRARRVAATATRTYLPDEMQRFLRFWRSRLTGFQYRPPER